MLRLRWEETSYILSYSRESLWNDVYEDRFERHAGFEQNLTVPMRVCDMLRTAAVRASPSASSTPPGTAGTRRASQFAINHRATSELSRSIAFSAFRVSADLMKLKLPVMTRAPSRISTLLWAIASVSSI